jgi:predicted negative regulator of RcsB-dependent stress response
MALDEYDEHEQSERVREWLRRNTASIAIGLLVGLGGVIGWHQWNASKAAHAEAAQAEYLKLIAAVDGTDATASAAASDVLRKEYGDTAFAVLAAFRTAQDALKRGELAAAQQALEWARDNAEDAGIKQLAALRLGRVKLAQGDAAGALALADGVTSQGYTGLREELRGDALSALGRNDEARTAYDAALAVLDAGAPQREFVQMKRDNVGVAVTVAATAPAAPAAAPEATAPAAAPAAPAASPAPSGG